MKLAAVIIWYNPQEVEFCVQKALSYARIVRTYIVDNSSCDNSELARQIPGVVYIPLLNNLGIAAAQNIGCERAREDGFEWVMTMDQDSYFDEGEFEKYIQETERYLLSDQNAVSFSVSIIDVSKDIIPLTVLIKRKLKSFLIKHFNYPVPTPVEEEPIDHPIRVFASANIIKLSVWDEIGRFDEALFIDEVDYDFCIRLQMAGYYITRFNTIHLNHKLGNRKFTVFRKISYHSGERLFYLIRNKLIENRRYRYATSLDRNYNKEVARYFKDYCIFSWKAPKNLLIFTRAICAYKAFIKTDQTFLGLKGKGLAK